MPLIKIDTPNVDELTHLHHVDNYATGDCADVYSGEGTEWKYLVATYDDDEVAFWGTNSEHAAHNVVARRRPPKTE